MNIITFFTYISLKLNMHIHTFLELYHKRNGYEKGYHLNMEK